VARRACSNLTSRHAEDYDRSHSFRGICDSNLGAVAGFSLYWHSAFLGEPFVWRCGHGSMVFGSCVRGDCEEIERVSDAWTVGILRSRDSGYSRDKGLPLVMERKPNKAPEPTTMAVTPRAMVCSISGAHFADARGAPAMVVAHL
jgi:hypothetical protein